MKEIGGYFEIESSHGNKEYYENLIPLNSACNALLYLCFIKEIKKIYLPIYLCDSVFECLTKNNINVSFYNIDSNFKPIFNIELDVSEYLYIVNFYGQLSADEIIVYKEKYKNIIIDNVQAFFSQPISGIDTIYSCRKYFGVSDGSYLSTNSMKHLELLIDDSSKRLNHLYGRIIDGATAHYDEYKKNEENFRSLEMKYMSNITHDMLKDIDYEFVKKTRNENYEYLEKRLSSINILKLSHPEGPFCYPLYLKNGVEVKKSLAKKKIYIPTLWPNLKGAGGIEEDYAMNILPIPCDQRYTIDDMKTIIQYLKKEVEFKNG